MKYTSEPMSSGKGGLRTKGESASTKKALANAKNSKHAGGKK